MPDSRARDPMPRDWGDAFGALPLEAPPRDAWQRLATALPPVPAPGRPARWHRPAFALAATAFFAMVIPLMQWRNAEVAAPPLQRAPAIASTAPSHPDTPVRPTDTEPATLIPSEIATPPPVAHASPLLRTVAPPAHAAAAEPARLDALYTESARLEAVLAQLPDSGAGNVAALAVSADLQDQVSHIDIALSQPALPAATHTALGEERVDTLRQLTGVQATQRWQVAAADTAIY